MGVNVLSQLHIENIAIIEKLDVYFDEGLNVLTGETGAGKSIIIDSINMVLGERTSRELIRSGQDKAVVEALFYIHSGSIKDALNEYGIAPDDDGALLICREIASEGKNVCRVNGRLVTTAILKEIGRYMVNIHGQHDNQSLLQIDKHIDFLDIFAGSQLIKTREQYDTVYQKSRSLETEIKKISGDEREKERKIDLLQFQLNEIDNAKLKPGEIEELTERRLQLGNAEKIMSSVSEAYVLLYTGGKMGASVHDNMAEVLKQLGEVERFDKKLNVMFKSLEELSFQFSELVYELRDYRENIEYDPAALECLEQRLDLIYKLKRKYGSSIEDILNYRDKIKQELDKLFSSEEKLLDLNNALNETRKQLQHLAGQLSAMRLEAARSLEERIIKELRELDMNKTRFKVQVDQMITKDGGYEFNRQGYDKVEFLISTNAGEPLRPLAKIASGGEMSRIMLAIKTVLSDIDEVNTLIFDEVDTGVSGRAAQRIAEKLSLIAQKKQVLCITHLPQIACMADQHYLIEKVVSDDKSTTHIEKLTQQNRKKELARIIGGALVTDLTLQHAEEMISIANKIKKDLGKN
ncbi:DNA repair protein RecN [Petroclostridium sp. X23]|uniref:DNA repair protein RecN n=1 Tax=Petroclostridium sp. X23 TaxID=3045146 RepID=UPI0024ADFC81|nr:DNA repair protein RecN [Petroclostridium sp. X23]WHH59629.1 DNA repair protein RecN [Petroclostridium sp. X23]